MERNILLLTLVLSLILLSTASSVQAQTEGLGWGITEGQRFDYRINGTRYDDGVPIQTVQEDCYVIVENLTVEEIDGHSRFFYDYTKYWANGSEFIYPMWPNINFIVYPVGNWTYISEQVIPDISIPEITYEAIDTDTVWGYTCTNTIVYYDVETLEISKSDGVTYHFNSVWKNQTTDELKGEYDVIRISQSLDPLLLVGSVGGIVVILVVAVVFMKKRGS